VSGQVEVAPKVKLELRTDVGRKNIGGGKKVGKRERAGIGIR
jgi:hypothetical protein